MTSETEGDESLMYSEMSDILFLTYYGIFLQYPMTGYVRKTSAIQNLTLNLYIMRKQDQKSMNK